MINLFFDVEKKISRGVTVIELLVVIAFLALIILVGVFSYKKQLFKGYDAKRKSDLNKIKIALEEYEKDNNCYPSFIPSCKGSDAGILKGYISKIPCDPHTKEDYVYYPDPTVPGCAKWFWIFTNMDNNSDQQVIEVGCKGYICGPDTNYGYNYYVASPNAPDPYRKPPLYGCFSGVCRVIGYRDDGLPECQPNYTVSDCRDLCQDDSGRNINQCNPY